VDNIYWSRIDGMSWTDPCDIELSNNTRLDFQQFDARLLGFFEGESNVSGSGCVSYEITSGGATWFGANYPDAYFETRLSIGCGIDFTSAGLLNSAGAPYSGLTVISNTDNNAAGDDEVIIRINRSVSGSIEMCFDVDCSEKPIGCPQTANFSMQNFFFPDPSCAASCEPNVSCETSIPLVFSCGSGMTACVTLLAGSLVLENELALYDGSWSEWGAGNGAWPIA